MTPHPACARERRRRARPGWPAHRERIRAAYEAGRRYGEMRRCERCNAYTVHPACPHCHVATGPLRGWWPVAIPA